jgi:hypothetical protein
MKSEIVILFVSLFSLIEAFNMPSNGCSASHRLQMAAVPPTESSSVGIIGRGYISVATAKISALQGYDTFMLCPPGQEETIKELINDEGDIPSNLRLVAATESDVFTEKIENADAIIIAVDDTSVMDESVIQYVLDPEKAKNLKRVVAMSRNLNGKGINFAVKASKISANSEVWDMGSGDDFKKFEKVIKECAKACSAQWTIARAGTLKGGACGESEFDQFLSRKFYEMTKKDIITWNLLFDCNVRGVTLSKGDVNPGPGFKAVFTATGTDGGLPGDTSRAGMAEALVRSLMFENTGDMDFGVGTKEERTPPSNEEWENLFSAL